MTWVLADADRAEVWTVGREWARPAEGVEPMRFESRRRAWRYVRANRADFAERVRGKRLRPLPEELADRYA